MSAFTCCSPVLVALCFAQAVGAQQPPSAQSRDAASYEALAQTVAGVIADSIPREYERSKDWGKTKRIMTGVNVHGHIYNPKFVRHKKDVNHGVWKQYRATLVEPEKNLVVRIENLRSLESGRIAFTLFVTAKLHGWGRVKIYQDGIHLGAYEAECDTGVRLWLDTEIALETTPSSLLTGIAVRPQVTDARLVLDDFRLARVSDVSGPIVEDFSNTLRHVIEDELKGPTLVAKINRSIEKRRDRLQFTPEMLLGGK